MSGGIATSRYGDAATWPSFMDYGIKSQCMKIKKLYYLNFDVHFTEKYIEGYILAHFQTNKT